MDPAWLAEQLAAGRSIESLARDTGRSPTTVAYWVNKHGLASQHTAKHAARGGIELPVLQALVEEGLSVRQIAKRRGVSATTVRHWLARYGLKTQPAHYGRRGAAKPREIVRECPRHGWETFVRTGGQYRCGRCNAEAVANRRRKVKAILVSEAGGACAICGYDRYLGALQFHHVQPGTKAFGLALRGLARSLDRCRIEAAKCVLLCANCHAEVEAGVATLPTLPENIRG